MVNKDQVKGAAKQLKGSINEAAGRATGNRRTQFKAKPTRSQARSKKRFGDIKEKVRARSEG